MSAPLWSIVLITALLGACAAVAPPAAPPTPVAPPVVLAPVVPVAPAPAPARPESDTRAAELVTYFAAIAKAGPPAQKKELAHSAASFGRNPTPYARLKLGGLYAMPAPGLRDDARALTLLEPLAAGNGVAASERPVADLALLIYAQVAERQRLAKDEARKQDELREQIEAMRSIERSILDREERQRAK